MSTISASTTSTTAFKVTSDTTGTLVFQTGATPTTALTLGSDQSATFAGSPTFSGGTANGVLYLNGSKAVTSGSALVFDGTNLGVGTTTINERLDVAGNMCIRNTSAYSTSNYSTLTYRAATASFGTQPIADIIFYTKGDAASAIGFQTRNGAGDYNVRATIDSSGNFGLGVTPSAWAATFKSIQSASQSAFSGSTGNATYVSTNWYYDGADKYIGTGNATNYYQYQGKHVWLTSPSGTAGAAITFTQAMTLDASGNLNIGVTSSDLAGGGTTTRISANSAVGYAATNVNTGAATYSVYQLGNNNSANRAGLVLFGSASTSSGLYRQDGVYLYSGGNGGVTISAEAAQPIYFATSNTERMRINAGAPILCLSGGNTSATGTGIAFPATQSASSDANTLDDYEEGTWTPVVTDLGTDRGATYAVRSARYVKIGSTVWVSLGLKLSGVGSGGTGNDVYITGLPFTSVNYGSYQEPGTAMVAGNLNTAANAYKLKIYPGSAATYLFTRISDGADTVWPYTDLTSTTFISAQLSYTVA